jgi:hypothetical protein
MDGTFRQGVLFLSEPKFLEVLGYLCGLPELVELLANAGANGATMIARSMEWSGPVPVEVGSHILPTTSKLTWVAISCTSDYAWMGLGISGRGPKMECWSAI